METNAQKKAVNQIIAEIQSLDLAPIKFKLMDKDEGHGWSREYADRMEIEYKRFLTLLAKFPEESIAPSKDVDKFWHGHILDTLKYADDCNRIFGYFLHHFPYFGMRGKEDAANLAAAAMTTKRLLRQEFGDTASSEAGAYCGASAGENAGADSLQVAYCGAASGISYCGAAASTGYCGAAVGENAEASREQSSYCGATMSVSYCGAAAGMEAKQPATQVGYCGAAGQASYCGAATIGGARGKANGANILNTGVRPGLPV